MQLHWYFSQLSKHTQQTYVTISFHKIWPITHTSHTLYYSTYHSLHIQYLQRSSWGWTVTVRNMYSWHLSTNKHFISATTLCISLDCIYIAKMIHGPSNVKLISYLSQYAYISIHSPVSTHQVYLSNCTYLKCARSVIYPVVSSWTEYVDRVYWNVCNKLPPLAA